MNDGGARESEPCCPPSPQKAATVEMKIRALKFVATARGVLPFRCEFAASAGDELTKLKARGVSAALVFRESELEELRGLKGLVVDRGTKSEAKGLAESLLGHERMPLIRGSYNTAGRLAQGVEALARCAFEQGDRNLYLIGTSEAIFDELWREASDSAARAKTGRRKGRSLGENRGRQSYGASDLLLELLPPRDVPKELEWSYIGNSVEAHLVRQLIIRAAEHDEPVLIVGDTGTGKEVVARAVHKHGPRADEPFVPVNCGAIPHDLFESELFGSLRGVATGLASRAGLWEMAGRGILFLDEIGDLTLHHQAKILRALQENKIRRVGAVRERRVHARVVAATNRDLYAMVGAEQFRKDLYYRLRSYMIRTPTLRGNPADISLVAASLWRKITKDVRAKLPREVLARLKTYAWPGNVRELRAVLLNVYTLFGEDGLGVEHLDAVFQFHVRGTESVGAATKAAREASLQKAERLRQLWRVDEVIRACRVTLQPVVEQGMMDEQMVSSVLVRLRQRLGELELLCLRPGLFRNKGAAHVIKRFKVELMSLHELMQKDAAEAVRLWTGGLDAECELALSAVFQEVEQLTATRESAPA